MAIAMVGGEITIERAIEKRSRESICTKPIEKIGGKG